MSTTVFVVVVVVVIQPFLFLYLFCFCLKIELVLMLFSEVLTLKKDQISAFPATVVKCMLEAMQCGSSEARERFPRLLQVIENHPDTMDLFISKVGRDLSAHCFSSDRNVNNVQMVNRQ